MASASTSSHRRGVALIALAGCLWSTSGLFIKLLPLNAWQIAGFRSLVAALAILVFARIAKLKISFTFDRWSLAAALSYTVVLVGFVVGTKLTKAANVIFLQFTAPIYLLAWEPWMLKTRLGRREILAVLICLGGMSLFFLGKLEGGDMVGNGLALLSGVGLAFFSLLLRRHSLRHPGNHPAGLVVLGNVAVFLVCLPWLVKGGLPSLSQAGVLIYLGAFQLGIAYLLYASAMRHVSATAASITSMLEAVFNPVWVFLGIGERPGPFALLGGAIILAVILWYTLRGPTVPVEPLEG